MGSLVKREDIPPWVKVPEDLKNPEVFLVHTMVLKSLFGPQGSRMPHFERVSKSMFEVEILESSELAVISIYGSDNHKVRAKWMLQSMVERCRMRLDRGMLMLEEALKTMELGQCLE